MFIRRAPLQKVQRFAACLFVGWLIAIGFLFDPVSAVAAEKRPNIIFILSDDQRHDFLGCAGHPVIQTPHLDDMAARGTHFRNAFVTTSICAASRATLLTGLLERTHQFTFRTPPLNAVWMNQSYPVLLREAGYRTGFIGKFGVKVPSRTESYFDWTRVLGRNPYWKKPNSRDNPTSEPRHVTDLTGDGAIEFIQSSVAEKPDTPFCLSISFNAVHAEDGDKNDPYPPPATEAGMYDNVTVDVPRLEDTFDDLPDFMKRSMNRDRWHWRWDTPSRYQKRVRDYYSLLSAMDRNIGRVRSALQDAGIAENTVILFMGDNGYYKGDRGFAGKWSHFEESLRVPLIVFDPRANLASHSSDETVLNLDIAPTILAMAGVDTPEHFQGKVLTGWQGNPQPFTKSGPRSFLCEHHMDHPSIPKWEGIRTERYTYARYYEQTPVFEFLHDRQSDPDQRVNLATSPDAADVLRRMRVLTDQSIESANQVRDKHGDGQR